MFLDSNASYEVAYAGAATSFVFSDVGMLRFGRLTIYEADVTLTIRVVVILQKSGRKYGINCRASCRTA